MVGPMVKVYTVINLKTLEIEKVFKKQDDAEDFCADRNTDKYIMSYGYMDHELE